MPAMSFLPPTSSNAHEAGQAHLVPSLLPKIDTAPRWSPPPPLGGAARPRNVPGSAGGNDDSRALDNSTLSKAESNDSISSSSGPKTASFFASSPVVPGPAAVIRQSSINSIRHARTPSGSSSKSISNIPAQLLPPPKYPQYNASPSGAGHSYLAHVGESGEMHDFSPSSSYVDGSPAQGIASSSSLRRNGSHVSKGRPSSSFRAQHDYDTSALSSASSIRSRRNWDEFEGKPVTPLPSPGMTNEAMDKAGSMFVDSRSPSSTAADEGGSNYPSTGRNSRRQQQQQQHGRQGWDVADGSSMLAESSRGAVEGTAANQLSPPSGLGFLNAPNASYLPPSGPWPTQSARSPQSPPTSFHHHQSPQSQQQQHPQSTGASSVGGVAMVTSASASSDASSSKTSSFFGTAYTPLPPARTPVKAADRGHARTSSNQSSGSASSWSTSSPMSSPPGGFRAAFPSLPSIASSAEDSSPSTPTVSLPSYERTSRFPTLPSRAEGAIPGIDAIPHPGQSRDDTASFAEEGDTVEVTPPRSAEQPGYQAGLGLGPPPAFDARGKVSTSRRVHGPSEDATGSSLVPRVQPGQSQFQPRSDVWEATTASIGESSRSAHGGNDHAPGPAPSALRLHGMSNYNTPSHRLPTSAEPGSSNTVTGRPSSAAGRPLPRVSTSKSIESPRMRQSTLDDDGGALESEDESVGRVGQYKVENTLGVGAFSRVVLARPTQSIHSLRPRPPPPSKQMTMTAFPPEDYKCADSAPDKDSQREKDAGSNSRRRSIPWTKAWRKSSSASANPAAPDPPKSPGRSLKAKLSGSTAITASSSNTIAPPQHPPPLRDGSPLPMSQSNSQDTTSAPPASMSASVSSSAQEERNGAAEGELVALKMMEREPCQQNERMRVSWVREVEVLKHIHHPSLIRFINSFSTPKHHVLVLERVAGGELFDLLAVYQLEVAQREWLVRRLFAELANAVGWMHSINLVHRDIKLENIILTRHVFHGLQTGIAAEGAPGNAGLLTPSSLGPIPLLKLTDFGLSRFIEPSQPLLETRCGSEEYASPELIIGKKYDGRKTDVWAMGVVLYALVCGSLPFLETGGAVQAPSASAGTAAASAMTARTREGYTGARDATDRKAHLLRIAKGDLRWPSQANDASADSPAPGVCPPANRLITPAAKHLVGRLLRRDAGKRMAAWDCFEDEWLKVGSFVPAVTKHAPRPGSSSDRTAPTSTSTPTPAPTPTPTSTRSKTLVAPTGESSAYGQRIELPPDPRSEIGQAWLRERAYVRAGEVSGVARDD